MSLVVTSDWHGDALTDGYPRHNDLRAAVDVVMGRLCDGRDQFLFLGDLSNPFGTWVHQAVAHAVAQASEMNARQVDNVWLTGNHDVMNDAEGSHTLLALKALDERFRTEVCDSSRVVTLGPYALVALPYTSVTRAYDPTAVVEAARAQVDGMAEQRGAPFKREVVAGHLMIEGIGPGSETTDMARGRDVFWPEEAVRKHFPNALWLNGHYHRQQVFRGIHIPGSLLRLTHGEEDHEPGFLVFD